MRTIYLETIISAPIEKVFDLARSIDVHIQTTGDTAERVVSGRSSGLVELNDSITWRAKHFGVYQYLTSVIIEMEKDIITFYFYWANDIRNICILGGDAMYKQYGLQGNSKSHISI